MADNIYCKDCKYHRMMTTLQDHCSSNQQYVNDPVNGKEPIFQDCRSKNADLNCKEYEAVERTIEVKRMSK